MLLSLAERFSFRIRMDRSNAAGPILVWGRYSVVRDIAGKEYLDLNSGQMCAALGHNHPRIVQAIQQSCEALLHSQMSLFDDREIILASRLAEIIPPGLTQGMFLTSGSGIVVAHSHSNDPMTCNAAIASLDIILEEGLVDVAASLGEYWAGHLRAWRSATRPLATSGEVACCGESSWSPIAKLGNQLSNRAGISAACAWKTA